MFDTDGDGQLPGQNEQTYQPMLGDDVGTSNGVSNGVPPDDAGSQPGDYFEPGGSNQGYTYTDPEHVLKVQDALQAKGFYTGPIDGVFTPAVEDALYRWHSSEGLDRHGPPTDGDLVELGIEEGTHQDVSVAPVQVTGHLRPTDILRARATTPVPKPSFFSSIPTWVWVAAAAAAGYYYFSDGSAAPKRRRRRRA